MTTLTVKINERIGLGKAVADLLRSTAKESKAVQLIDAEEKSPYNPEFVKKIRESEKQIKEGKVTRITNRKELSAFLGLNDEA